MGSCASVVKEKNIKYSEFIKNKKYDNKKQNVKMLEVRTTQIHNTTPRYI